MRVTAKREHEIACGHRVVGHEGYCARLHGHGYRIEFTCAAEQLDTVGRVLDFSVIKSRLCMWLELNWDHRFLVWREDELIRGLYETVRTETTFPFVQSLVWLPFNPTAENIAAYLLEVVGPRELAGTGVTLVEVVVHETSKCSARACLDNPGLV